jgi:hypothetical protein
VSMLQTKPSLQVCNFSSMIFLIFFMTTAISKSQVKFSFFGAESPPEASLGVESPSDTALSAANLSAVTLSAKSLADKAGETRECLQKRAAAPTNA